MCPKLRERPVGDVLAPIRAVFVVGVEGETLRARARAYEMEIDWSVRGHYHERLV